VTEVGKEPLAFGGLPKRIAALARGSAGCPAAKADAPTLLPQACGTVCKILLDVSTSPSHHFNG
jgi:hypothetical protein